VIIFVLLFEALFCLDNQTEGLAFFIMEEYRMVLFFTSIVFVLSMISLSLALATVKKSKATADVTMKLHIFLVQAVVVLSVLSLAISGYCVLKFLLSY
jgi:hypothetical protein